MAARLRKGSDMTKKKDLKDIIRERMKKTGESYTAARASLIGPDARHILPRAQWATLAGTKDKTLVERTGRTWGDWVDLLDKARAFEWEHPKIARFINETYPEVGSWWAQSLTVGYERIHGIREVGQMGDGSFAANKSRTFPVGVNVLFEMFTDSRRRKPWFGPGVKGLRNVRANKSLVLELDDGTEVNIYFTDKGPTKSGAALQHQRLSSKADIEGRKTFWTERLDALGQRLQT